MANSLKTKEEEATLAANMRFDENEVDFSSYTQPNRLKLLVSNKNKEFCSNCTYIIHVLGQDAYKGKISVIMQGHTSSAATPVLVVGRPVQFNMEEDETRIYKFISQNNDDLLFHLNALSGEVDYHIALEHSDPEGNLSDDDKKIWSGNEENGRYVFGQETTVAQKGKAHYIFIKARSQAYVVLSISNPSDYTMISDATPMSISLSEQGEQFYYMVNPHESLSKIIIEAIPQNVKTAFGIYIKKITIEPKDSSDFSLQKEVRLWDTTPEEIIEDSTEMMEYTGDGRDYKDITLNIANEDKK